MNDEFKTTYINDFKMATNTTTLDDLGTEVMVLKFAVGLLFRRLPPEHRTAYLMELQQFNAPEFHALAEQLNQFNQ